MRDDKYQMRKSSRYKQGFFRPLNREKYRGDPTNIVWRSSWELKVMSVLDQNPDVVQWSSEEVIVPYRSPLDQRVHRYFIDFFVKKRNGETALIELKPHTQTLPPKPGKKRKKTQINEVKTYMVNQAKWQAAKRYCDERKWQFIVLTEKELFGG
jgi:hypothetical protein